VVYGESCINTKDPDAKMAYMRKNKTGKDGYRKISKNPPDTRPVMKAIAGGYILITPNG